MIINSKATQAFLRDAQQYQTSKKVLVDLGDHIYSEAKRVDNKIILRVKSDLYVEYSREEAQKVVGELVGLYEHKVGMIEKEIVKIMMSMREVEELIRQYECVLGQ